MGSYDTWRCVRIGQQRHLPPKSYDISDNPTTSDADTLRDEKCSVLPFTPLFIGLPFLLLLPFIHVCFHSISYVIWSKSVVSKMNHLGHYSPLSLLHKNHTIQYDVKEVVCSTRALIKSSKSWVTTFVYYLLHNSNCFFGTTPAARDFHFS